MITINFETGEKLSFDKDSLKGNVFSDIDFHRAVLDGYDLERANFKTSKLRSTSLRNINGSYADFSDTPLMTSDFTEAKLENANFSNARVMYTDFSKAVLIKADMTDADVRGSVFKGSHLEDAVMLCKGLEEAELEGAFYNSETVWPNGFDPVLKGAIFVNS